MRKPRTLALVLAFLATPLSLDAASPVFKCVINGSVTYQSSPCPSGEVRPPPTVEQLNAAQQKKLREQERESPREYVDRESHYVWGKRVLMKLVEVDAPASVQLRHTKLLVTVRPGTDQAGRAAIVSNWYRQILKAEVPGLIATWAPRVGVEVNGFFVQKMKTKWGSCNPIARTLRLNTELAKKPKDLLEYVVVHEMLHLVEPTHGERFMALMERHYPKWREARVELNELPLGAGSWGQ